jgi:hypothetical protein
MPRIGRSMSIRFHGETQVSSMAARERVRCAVPHLGWRDHGAASSSAM